MPTSPGAWLVGFRFRTTTGHLVLHYYVIATATDTEHARVAAHHVHSAAEREARGHAAVDADWTEVRRMRCDPLGECHLSSPEGPATFGNIQA